jgi:hypothetical protein
MMDRHHSCERYWLLEFDAGSKIKIRIGEEEWSACCCEVGGDSVSEWY